MVRSTMWHTFLDVLPRGYALDEADWQRRHRFLLRLLAAHVPGLAAAGFLLGRAPMVLLIATSVPAACVLLGYFGRRHRRTAAVLVTAGLVYSSGALVGLTRGAIEAHFHFFIIIGFIALYQDWAPFLFNILFTVISHGVGSAWQQSLIFNHGEGQANPWLWSLIHGVAVLFACAGMMVFWRVTEDSQNEKDALARRLAEAEIGKRQFTSDLLVNLARRNQSLLYRQLEIINQLEESERDPDALTNLFTLDHLATRVRRNAESLLVLSGEKPPRTWSEPVALRDVMRAAIAETEDLERVVFIVDERPAVAGNIVTDLTHLLAELTENAVRSSPPDSVVTIRARAHRSDPGGHVITVEDWGIGMTTADLAAANVLLADPPEVDLSVSQRLGFHVVARLAARHRITVTLADTPGSGVTAVVTLPAGLFESVQHEPPMANARNGQQPRHAVPAPLPKRQVRAQRDPSPSWPIHPDRVPRPESLNPGYEAPVGLPAPTGDPRTSPGREFSPFGGDGTWHGWWDHSEGPDARAVNVVAPVAPVAPPDPVPSPRPRGASQPSPHTPSRPALETSSGGRASIASPAADPATGLRRRVPQSHLVPELRDTVARPAPRPDHHHGDTAAAAALSRYQASRQAAQMESSRSADGNGRATGHGDGNEGWRT
jgi:signal transduction histidine kinase